jgi:hypothetical protein
MNELTTQTNNPVSLFFDGARLENAFKAATYVAKSDIIPASYKGKPENCLVAMEIADRLQMSPMMVMQNLDIIYGRPSWNSKYCIAAIQQRFGQIRYEENNLGKIEFNKQKIDNLSCRVVVGDRKGPVITVEMAVKSGWYGRKDSKWPEMPEQMLAYRAATFFARRFCPEFLIGMPSADEVINSTDSGVENNVIKVEKTKTEPKKEKPKKQKPVDVVDAVEVEPEPVAQVEDESQADGDLGQYADLFKD